MQRNVKLRSPLAVRTISTIESRLGLVKPGEPVSVFTLCGEDYWSELSSGQRKEVGRIVSLAVSQGRLPLISNGKSSAHHKLYNTNEAVSSAKKIART